MSQSWLRNEIFSGIRDRDMKIPKKSRVQNIRDMKTPKDAEWKLPKLPKSRVSKFIFWDIPKSRILVVAPKNKVTSWAIQITFLNH